MLFVSIQLNVRPHLIILCTNIPHRVSGAPMEIEGESSDIGNDAGHPSAWPAVSPISLPSGK